MTTDLTMYFSPPTVYDANLGEFHFREVPRGSVATEPCEGSGREAGKKYLLLFCM